MAHHPSSSSISCATMLLALLVAVSSISSTLATAPIAPHLVYTVPKGSEVVIRLTGYDEDGDRLTARVTALPESGSVWQLSQVFSDYGYAPKRGASITTVAGAGVTVTGSRNRIVYTPPPNTNAPTGRWARFAYTVSDGTTTSEPGLVWLVPEHKHVVASHFSSGLDGWSVVNNGARASKMAAGGLTWEPFSRGLLNHYVLATDAEIHLDRRTKLDTTLFYFQSPAKFLGNHAIAYGGTLQFAVASAAGSFSKDNLNIPSSSSRGGLPVVILDCATCARGSGIRLAVFADAMLLDGATKRVSFTLTEQHWLKDPKNTLLAWGNPTQCEMVEVLSGLTGFQVLADYTTWYESIALDDVTYTHGKAVPVECADIYY